jgi:hypothetical protein
MDGKIIFNDATSLGEFLRAFCPSTAVFVVKQYGDEFTLEFTGGY